MHIFVTCVTFVTMLRCSSPGWHWWLWCWNWVDQDAVTHFWHMQVYFSRLNFQTFEYQLRIFWNQLEHGSNHRLITSNARKSSSKAYMVTFKDLFGPAFLISEVILLSENVYKCACTNYLFGILNVQILVTQNSWLTNVKSACKVYY